MALKKDGFTQQFAARHPEAGEINKGSTLTGEQAIALGDVFDSKIAAISRQAELTQRDILFVGSVIDLGARNIVFCLEQRSLSAPQDEELVDGILDDARMVQRDLDRPESSRPKYYPEDKLIAELSSLTGGNVVVTEDPSARVPAETFAGAVMPFFGAMVAEQEGGLPVSEYMAGNLQDLLVQYEMHDAQMPAR